MLGIVVTPGTAGSARLETVGDPKLRGPGSVLIRTVSVGVCGTDRQIVAGEYGAAPPDSDYLVLGHEVLGVVAEDAAGFTAGTSVAATVRRPCGECENCAAGESDACSTGRFTERGILGLHGFATELFVEEAENLVALPRALGQLGVLAEPASICRRGLRQAQYVGRRQGWQPRKAFVLGAGPIGMLTLLMLRLERYDVWLVSRGPTDSRPADVCRAAGARYVSTRDRGLPDLAEEVGGADLIMESAGSAQLSADAISALAPNGVLCLRGIDHGGGSISVPASVLGRDLVLGNRAVVGSTNSRADDWATGVEALAHIQAKWPGVLEQLMGTSVPPDRFEEALAFHGGKATVSFSSWGG